MNARGRRFRVTKGRVGFGLFLVASAILLFAFRSHLPLSEIRASIASLNIGMLILALTLLPLVGFPLFPLHVIAGVRFGIWEGMAIITATIIVQHVLAYGIVRLAPGIFEKRFARLRAGMAHSAHTSAAMFTGLVPGVPYFVALYVLPLVGVPLSTYLLVSAPLHSVCSIVAVAFGDLSDNLSPARLALFLIYGLLLTVLSAWILQRLRRQFVARVKSEPDPGHDRSRQVRDRKRESLTTSSSRCGS